jgi:hypothetical protein
MNKQINFMVVSGKVSDTFKKVSRNNGRNEYELNYTQFSKLVIGNKLRAATIPEQFGPGFKPIFWSPTNKPFCMV